MTRMRKSFTLIFYVAFFRAVLRLSFIIILHLIILTLLGIAFFVVENRSSTDKDTLPYVGAIRTLDVAASYIHQSEPNDVNSGAVKSDLLLIPGAKEQTDGSLEIDPASRRSDHSAKAGISHIPSDPNKCIPNMTNHCQSKKAASADKDWIDGVLNSIYVTLLAATLGLGKYYPCTFCGKVIILLSGLIGIITLGIFAGIAFRAVEVAHREASS